VRQHSCHTRFRFCPSFICIIYYHCHSFHGKPPTSGLQATGSLRDITLATLSISSHELNTPFLSHLLYVSASISTPSSPSVYCALVDSGATINLIHKSVVSFLGLTVEPHLGLLATLADGKTVLSCSCYVSLSYTIAEIPYSGTFFVAPLRAQSLILGMPYLERENPVIDW